MKPATTLKELITPPFEIVGMGIYDQKWKVMDICDIIGALGNAKLNIDFRNFAVQALNEKWERDFGEPLRWVYVHFDLLGWRFMCPRCTKSELMYSDFCPNCGVRLLPPEGGAG